jgi:cytoskeletal protein RodZ
MSEEKSVLGLATVRRNRGITLQQISDATKIGVRALEAIETGDFRRLPGGIYATSYIRQYAAA